MSGRQPLRQMMGCMSGWSCHLDCPMHPGTSIRLMNESLRDFIGKFVIFYLDDILVFMQTEEEHLKHLRYVLERLQQEKLLINVKKCTFMKTELVYLDFFISRDGLKMDPKKCKQSLIGLHQGTYLR